MSKPLDWLGKIPFERLFAAMFSVQQRRHEQAGGGEFLELNVSDPEQMLDMFLQTCTVRQVRMLREIALELKRLGSRLRSAPPAEPDSVWMAQAPLLRLGFLSADIGKTVSRKPLAHGAISCALDKAVHRR
jgi:hypothetical protein